jgi:hypothetical protein
VKQRLYYLVELGKIYRTLNDPGGARFRFAQAMEIFESLNSPETADVLQLMTELDSPAA